MAKLYYVYLMTNRSRTLYTGVTSDLRRRVYQHKHKLVPGFTCTYNITLLVHYETTRNVLAAIAREKQIKGWSRAKKVALIEAINPNWKDLSADWYQGEDSSPAARNSNAARPVIQSERSERRIPTLERDSSPAARNDIPRGARNDIIEKDTQ